MRARMDVAMSLLGCWILLCGCAAQNALSSADSQVVIDGREFTITGSQSLLEMLPVATYAGRLAEERSTNAMLLVLVDGVVQVDGLRALASIPVVQVDSVTTMRGIHAIPLYGPRARSGAIIVRTRAGRGPPDSAQGTTRDLRPSSGVTRGVSVP